MSRRLALVLGSVLFWLICAAVFVAGFVMALVQEGVL